MVVTVLTQSVKPASLPPQGPRVGRSSKHFRKTWPIIAVNLYCLDRLNPGPKWLPQLTIFLSKRQKLL